MVQDITFMQLALAQAEEAYGAGEIPVGAVVVKEGRVISVGRNMCIGSNDPSAHAELVALRAAAQTLGNYRLDGCELYVTLEPCPMCAGAVLHARLKRVIYGASDAKTGAAGSVLDIFASAKLNHHTQVSAGLLADECSSLLRRFFQVRRQAKVTQSQAIMEDALRTPASAFTAIENYTFSPHFFTHREKLSGWRMHYLDHGPADAANVVLCLHDIPGWSYRYRTLIPALSDRGIRAIAPDLIGFGMSDKPKRANVHTANLHLSSLQLLLISLGTPKVLVIAEGSAVYLARMLVGNQVAPVIKVFQIPSDPRVVSDLRPYPDTGHQAARRASAALLFQMEEASRGIKNYSLAGQLDGSPNMMALQIEAALRSA